MATVAADVPDGGFAPGDVDPRSSDASADGQ
jgi:hypothetical protein